MSTPPFLVDMPKDEFEERVKIDEDLCLIRAGGDQTEDLFAIRVMLDIPIHGVDAPFNWGVWVSQSRASFFKYVDSYNDDQSGEMSFGWLPVTIPHYRRTQAGAPTENLACDVVWHVPGVRPQIILHESDHPLYRDQRDGISWVKAVEIARAQMERVHSTH